MKTAPNDLSVRFIFSFRELYFLSLAAAFRDRLILGQMLVSVTMSLIPVIASEQRSLRSRVIFAAILVTVTVVASVGVFIQHFANNFPNGNHQAALCEQTITLSEKGVIESSEFVWGIVKWSTIDRVECAKNYLRIYLTNNRHWVIPRRAFASPAAALEFENRLREGVAAAAKPVTA